MTALDGMYESEEYVNRNYPSGCHVRFGEDSTCVGRVFGHTRFGRDWILRVVDCDGYVRDWHPGNVTRVEKICRWKEVKEGGD